MHLPALFGVGIGLFGIGAAVRALMTGNIRFVFARLLSGWGPTLAADFDRDEHPVGFWGAIGVYGLGGLLILVLAGRKLFV